MSGLSCFSNIPWFFFAFGGITGCGSASLKLCFCDAAHPWSQSPSQDSQCIVAVFEIVLVIAFVVSLCGCLYGLLCGCCHLCSVHNATCIPM